MKIKSLLLENFKGAKNQKVTFSNLTVARGTNETGKSTIIDAWQWLITGKDQSGTIDFEVKQKVNGKTIDRQDVSVTAEIEQGEFTYKIKRVLKEKWVKPRNQQHEEFQGNETLFFIDDVPVKTKREWDEFLNSLIPQELFVLLSNPLAFNNLDWIKRRSYLEQMVTMPQVDEVCGMFPEGLKAKEEYSKLKPNETVDSKRKALNQEINTIKKHVAELSPRIDEVQKQIDNINEMDFSETEKQIEQKETEIRILEQKETNYQQAQKELIRQQQWLYQERSGLEADKQKYIQKTQAEANESYNKDMAIYNEKLQYLTKGVQETQTKIQEIEFNARQMEAEKVFKEKELDGLRELFTKRQADVYDAGMCNACQRPFEHSEQAEINFNKAKANDLQNINKNGVELKSKIETLVKDIQTFVSQRSELLIVLNKQQQEVMKYKETIPQQQPVTLPDTTKFDNHIAEIDNKIASIKIETNPQDAEEKAKLQAELKTLTMSLGAKSNLVTLNARMDELQAELKQNLDRLTLIEGIEYTLKQYSLNYYSLLESRVNSLFQIGKFSFAKELINGEIEQRCVCTVNGVEYHSVNTANKVNAGIEIINVLSSHFRHQAPIFIDNAEGVVKYIPTNSQLCLFIVDENYKKLEFQLL